MPLTTSQVRLRLGLLALLIVLIFVVFPLLVRNDLYNGYSMVTTPLAIGTTVALLLGMEKPVKKVGGLLRVSIIVLFFIAIGLGLMLGAGEGIICLLIFMLILLVPYIGGVLLGFAIQKKIWSLRLILAAVSISLLSATGVKPTYQEARLTQDSIRIAASAQRVWEVLNAPVSFRTSTDFWFRNGVSYPTTMQVRSGSFEQKELYCTYNNGVAIGRIYNYVPLQGFRFEMPDSLIMMEEQNLFGKTKTMHLTHHLQVQEGFFQIIPIDSASCELRAGSVFQHKFRPVSYYNFWFEHVFHRLHGHVLNAIRQQAESSIIPGQK